MLLNRRQFPPGGFSFFQPQTDWRAPGGLTFDQVVDAIIKHRLANPKFAGQWSVEKEDIENELDEYTCIRIAQNPNYCQAVEGAPPFLPGTSELPRPIVPSNSPSGPSVAVASKLAAGVATIADWRGSGGEVVAQEEADRRAAICVGCPKNDSQHGVAHFFVMTVAAAIQLEIGRKNDMKLKTPFDAELGVCKACWCCNRLKIWSPMEFITKHMSKSVTLPAHCWIEQ